MWITYYESCFSLCITGLTDMHMHKPLLIENVWELIIHFNEALITSLKVIIYSLKIIHQCEIKYVSKIKFPYAFWWIIQYMFWTQKYQIKTTLVLYIQEESACRWNFQWVLLPAFVSMTLLLGYSDWILKRTKA